MVYLWTVLAISLMALGVLAVSVYALVRRVKVLSSAMRGFQDELQPLLAGLQRGSAEATSRLESLHRLENLQRRSSGRKAGVRLGR